MLFNFVYAFDLNKIYYMHKPIVNIVERSDSALHVNFNERKIFVNGKINDWIYIMINHPGNTPEIKKALKHIHTYSFLGSELTSAISDDVSTDKFKQVIEKVRLYLPEYINYYKDMSFIKKLYYYGILYLPLPIVRTLCKIRVCLRETANKIKSMFTKEDGEIIPYW